MKKPLKVGSDEGLDGMLGGFNLISTSNIDVHIIWGNEETN